MIPQRIFSQPDPYSSHKHTGGWYENAKWPTQWVSHPDLPVAPFAAAYRKTFTLDANQTLRAHVSADERYELFLDGERVAMGSERGDTDNWFYETFDFSLTAGEHTFVALVWSVGEERAYAQATARHGWLFSPQSDEHIALLGTGVAEWDAKLIDGLNWTSSLMAWGTGENLEIFGDKYPWGIERGTGDGWIAASALEVAIDDWFLDSPTKRYLKPAMLPPMLDERRHVGTVRLVSDIPSLETHSIPVSAADNIEAESATWQSLISGSGTVEIAPNTRRRVILDLDNYYCARPELKVSGGTGATIRVDWEEALYTQAGGKVKGNRDEIEGKFFSTAWVAQNGIGDRFHPEGGAGRVYTAFWWQAGRYVEICVETKDEALTLDNFCIRETRYPMELEAKFSSDDARLENIAPIMMRALQACAHETYMDCPFWEQLMYVGDTRLEVLTTWAATRDDRLPRKAVAMFDASRQLNGLTQSRYPTKVRQVIPPFSLWHCCMIHDRALWQNTPEFDRTLLPGARGVLDYFLARRNSDGLVESPEGWNYVDWVPEWKNGEPAGAHIGCNGTLNWQTVLTLRKVAELEAWHGEPEMAARWNRAASELHSAINATFWNESRGLYSEDIEQTSFSQHAQCLAVLSGLLGESESRDIMNRVIAATDLAETTIMFRFYLMEALHQTRDGAALWAQLPLWFQLPDWGLKTTWEEADPNTTRSDCHAWGAHPLYHYFTSILGIRPASQGFRTVHIAPLLGDLKTARGEMPHPDGTIAVNYVRSNSALTAEITLPQNISGTFEWNGKTHSLNGGAQKIEL
ncbi:MAG TPA: alpha-L-rhamnosidase C-terminal domain-containing protein [Abditibacteriaceae bacterium]|jgi:hypothetical protein